MAILNLLAPFCLINVTNAAWMVLRSFVKIDMNIQTFALNMNVNKSSLQGPVNLHIFYNFLNGRVAVLVAQISRSLDGRQIDSFTEGNLVFIGNILKDILFSC